MDRPATPINQGGQQVEPECPSIKEERKAAAKKAVEARKDSSVDHEKARGNLSLPFSDKGNKTAKPLFK